jgi:hypothetical protein
MEQFSWAYIRAVAAAAGFAADRPELDRDSVDLTISASADSGLMRTPRLDLQAKSTADLAPPGDRIPHFLKLKNYNDLRVEEVMVPRILVLVLVPDDPLEWLDQTEEQLALRRCGYWISLRGSPETENATGVTVKLPRSQLFSVDALKSMLERIDQGGVP